MFNVPEPLCYESLQIVTLFFSILTVWTMYRILKEFEISEKLMVLLTAFLSFHPFFMIMSVTVTNDCLAMYFMALAVWYTIRWMKKPEVKSIIVIAFAVGLAMASKLNSVIVSFGIAAVFIYVFWKNRKEYKKYLPQFAVFLLICAPIGLFNTIRNHVEFDVPLTYIQKINSVSPQFISDSSALSRLGVPSKNQISYAFPSFDPTVERNVWVQVVRTSLFDELSPNVGSSFLGQRLCCFY